MCDYNEYNKGNKREEVVSRNANSVLLVIQEKLQYILLIFLLSNLFIVDFRLSVNF